jgi:hypothetical protein
MLIAERRNLLALAALLFVSPSAPYPVSGQEQKPRQERVWKVKESATRLWIADGMLVSGTTREAPESIPLSAIKTVDYETTVEHRAADEIGAWLTDTWQAAPDAGKGAVFLVIPMAVGSVIPGLFLPLKSTRHLIYLEWELNGKVEERVYVLQIRRVLVVE